jgi:hypothetical protein
VAFVKSEDLVAQQNWDMDQTYLYMIAAMNETLDQAVAALNDVGRGDLAASLLKLQQDAGVEIIIGGVNDEPAPGPATAALRAAYEPLSVSRLDILRAAHDLVSAPGLKNELAALIECLPEAAEFPRNQIKPGSPF